MAIGLVQSPSGNASIANSPTTLVASWAATAGGNLLVLMVSVTGTNPTVTTPLNWFQIISSVTSTISTYIFVFPSSTPGMTGLTLSCSAVNGGISASFFEFSGMPGSFNVTYGNGNAGTGTVVPQLVNQNIENTNELSLVLVANNATATFTSGSSRTSEWAGNVNGIASTTATTNVRNNTYWATNADGDTPLISGTLSGSVIWAAVTARLTSLTSGGITYDSIGGNSGILVGQFFQGMIGG